MQTDSPRFTQTMRNRWFMPSFCLFLGVLVFIAATLGGDVGYGAFGLGLMVAIGAVFLFGGRSETLSGLGGPGRDERWAMIDLRATAAAGSVVIVALIVAFLYELAEGRDAEPYSALLAIGGATYIAAVLIGRWRS